MYDSSPIAGYLLLKFQLSQRSRLCQRSRLMCCRACEKVQGLLDEIAIEGLVPEQMSGWDPVRRQNAMQCPLLDPISLGKRKSRRASFEAEMSARMTSVMLKRFTYEREILLASPPSEVCSSSPQSTTKGGRPHLQHTLTHSSPHRQFLSSQRTPPKHTTTSSTPSKVQTTHP